MFNKIFLALFAIAILVMSVLTFFCYTQLKSIGFPPPQIVQNFTYYEGIFRTSLLFSSLLLLIFANIILWMNRKAWSLWLTFAYFTVFTLLNMWWLGDSLVAYKKQNNLWEGGFAIGGLVAAFFVVIIGLGLFFNQFLVIKMRDKIYGNPLNKKEDLNNEKVVENDEKESENNSEIESENNSEIESKD